ncbi:MAG: hypothetical protein K8F52_02845 [Candidatus Scalindua rubra]|uniref:Uncharacterized protein n=1 Tax=Candidatus Scalindua brodae TaxID=237368 RepID=A0A0B0EMP1_9BACT|nr:MAG: hypothetical protein SCABRO_01818 [Candidatus Scalindua brodae]MBZ0107584.1 hypothetical protein [Candidatus Scalindua rubra]TWU34793.1 hypothetical protein S225a_11510 [Candidatus Brocadiaceae bacterium S225]
MLRELLTVAPFCDGVRCDMAMPILKRIQKQIWGERAFAGNKFSETETGFWQDATAEVKKIYPDFNGLLSRNALFKDLISSAEYVYNSEEIAERGFYLDIPPYGFHLFKITGVD